MKINVEFEVKCSHSEQIEVPDEVAKKVFEIMDSDEIKFHQRDGLIEELLNSYIDFCDIDTSSADIENFEIEQAE